MRVGGWLCWWVIDAGGVGSEWRAESGEWSLLAGKGGGGRVGLC